LARLFVLGHRTRSIKRANEIIVARVPRRHAEPTPDVLPIRPTRVRDLGWHSHRLGTIHGVVHYIPAGPLKSRLRMPK
jgi:hypothetical protein